MIFSIKKFIRSILNALRGVKYASKEQNFRIQAIISVIIVFFAIFFNLKTWERVVLILIIVFILVLEILNSVFERVVDILEPRVHPYAKVIKDMMAAAVLISSLGAIFIGVIVFGPYIEAFLKT